MMKNAILSILQRKTLESQRKMLHERDERNERIRKAHEERTEVIYKEIIDYITSCADAGKKWCWFPAEHVTLEDARSIRDRLENDGLACSVETVLGAPKYIYVRWGDR
jgi:hypothetical protein